MAKVCQITGKKAQVGNNVSHSKRRTKRKFEVNLHTKKYYWVEQDMWIVLRVSAHAMRTINKIGLNAALKKAEAAGNLDFKKAKGNRVQVILECTEHKASGMPGMSRYITTKNRKNTTGRMELKKYNPILKKVTVHKEIK